MPRIERCGRRSRTNSPRAGCRCRCCGAIGTRRRWLTDVVGAAGGRRPCPAARPGHLGVLVVLVVPAVPRGLRRRLAATGLVGTVRIDKIRPYFDQPDFSNRSSDGTAAPRCGGAGRRADVPTNWRLLFTTHSIPSAMADSSGSAALGERPARRRVRRPASRRLPGGRRRGGRAHRTPPSTGSWPTSRGPGHRRCRGWSPTSTTSSPVCPPRPTGVVVVPIGFVSDHVEVIWDLDHEAADAAADRGLCFWRVPTPGTDPRFVASLADLIGRAGRSRGWPRRVRPGCPATGGLPAGLLRELARAETDHGRPGFGRRLGRHRDRPGAALAGVRHPAGRRPRDRSACCGSAPGAARWPWPSPAGSATRSRR